MLLVSPLSTRNQFGKLLLEFDLCGTAVEIGTHRGDFSQILLKDWPGELHCVDPWYNPPGYEEQARYLWGNGNRQDDFLTTVRAVSQYGDRVRLHTKTSKEACKGFVDGTLDFIYVDGDHRYEHVKWDLTNWWSKLKSGGILGGHDIVCPGPKTADNWGGEIQPAVIFFAAAINADVYMIVEENNLPWSYYLVKP